MSIPAAWPPVLDFFGTPLVIGCVRRFWESVSWSPRSAWGPGGEPHYQKNSGSVREQVGFLRRQFLQDGDLPFTDVLTEEVIAQALSTIGVWLDRVFSPLVTLWVFLAQALSADHSCRAAALRHG